MVYNSEVRFNYNEGNFTGLLDLDMLKQHFSKLDFKTTHYLDELCMNIPSLFLMLQRFDEARSLIEKCKKISQSYDLKETKAKLLLMEASINIRKQDKNYELNRILSQSEGILRELEIDEGIGECFYLRAIN
jgi:hypothetical protein